MQLTQSSVGRKIIMAVTGIVLVAFVCVHLLGNTSIFVGADAINAYAQKLHSLGPLVWVFRLVMLAAFVIHIFFGIQLTIENKAATPEANVQVKRQKTGFAAETMVISGLVLLAFVIYHLLHFTVRVTNPEIYVPMGDQGMVDVYYMVVMGFQAVLPVAVYVVAMGFLFLHVSHGFQSFFQTLGLSNDKSLPITMDISKVIAVVLLLGYISIPVLIVAGLVKI
ncbi:MAG: succinate dehydrogenase cytochrome b subunit [Deltaproteobacteria bacterium]|jgi:succinate dehydrogenase / fumarate reductase cytochrome b subunit|nr:succinate dehydrogenase cytochrome b subunit [Deltaproteobacteria bacterium]MBW2504447.1 succinate dehydrogenase cytochrome b subunit [Deltaproteobacteria bacterium]